jgi:flavin-dependent dehydrogenase
MNTYQLIRDIPIEEGYDVLIAGGGPAGAAAAICAGRLGAKVLLVEATGCLGGMGTSGLVTAFNPMNDGERMLARGIMEEIVEAMYERGFIPSYITPAFWRKKLHHWTPFNPEGLKLLLDELAIDACVEVRFFTSVIDADAKPGEGHVEGIILHNIEGYRYVRAKAFIDATGDAVLADICGAKCREAGRDTPVTLCLQRSVHFLPELIGRR